MAKEEPKKQKQPMDTNLVTRNSSTGEYDNSFLLDDADKIPALSTETKKTLLKSLIKDYKMTPEDAMSLVKLMK